MNQDNGGIIGKINTPTTTVASGVWTLQDQFEAQTSSIWPLAFPQITIANSCRFDDGSSDYLNKTFSTPTNNDICTLSFWIKKTGSSNHAIWSNGSSNADETNFVFQESGKFEFKEDVSSSATFQLITNRLFRDSSAYYHIVIAFDTTQGTSSNRVKLYVNGVQETSFATETYPSQNTNVAINSNIAQYIGRRNRETDQYFDGYLAEMVFVDGVQLDPTSFGEFNTATGIWTPKKIGQIASAGTNSFYLDFKDSSNVGKDSSGLSNNFTVNNLTSIDQSTDTCVENFATYNGLDDYFQADTLSNANLTMTGGGQYAPRTGNIALDSGKWYWEIQVNNWESSDGSSIGVSSELATAANYEFVNKSGATVGYGYFSNGVVYGNASSLATGYSTASGTHIIGVALNLTDNKIAWSYDGTWQGSTDPGSGNTNMISITDPASLTSGTYFPAFSQKDNSRVLNVNFGSPSFSISSGNSDANGHGNFEYAVPSGYYALNTSNLNTYG